VNVNAVVSGQAGVALLVNGAELKSIHAGRSGEIVRRSPSEVRFLLGDAGDLKFLEDIEVEEVIRRLELASTQMDALHTALILLDGSLPPETRQIAAEELQELLEDEAVTVFVESVLFAHPLPADADLSGAFAACTPETEQTRRLLQRLASLEQYIGQVHYAWEGIPARVFGAEKDRRNACSVAVREGLFRQLVFRQADLAPIDPLLTDALIRAEMGLSREIVLAWVAPLREYPIYESESLFVAELPLRYCPAGRHVMDPDWHVCPYCATGGMAPPPSPPLHFPTFRACAEERRLTQFTEGEQNAPLREAAVGAGRRVVGVLVTYTWRTEGEVFPIREGRNVVGSSTACEIHIATDSQMSGRHACIVYRSGSFWIADELSMNGTFVDGKPVEETQRLPHSAVLRTGGTVWRFMALEPPSES